MKKLKVAVGLSGGVDSAVSAYLLKKHGFDISGVYLHCFDDDAPGCRGKQDRQDALKVAVHLKIPFRVLDFRRQYKSSVIGYFKKEYLAGRTPNPDVVCNRDIKFGLLLDWCVKNGFDYLATGHYAKLARGARQIAGSHQPPATSHQLARPADEHKDQTYFLWAVPREKFRRVLFPLADFTKKDVRSVAKLSKIPVADKPDSTGICFIGEVKVEDFLKRLGVKEKIGEVVIRTKDYKNYKDYKGRSYQVIGSHRGVWFYTIGQRHGFTISSKFKVQSSKLTDRPPLYVIEKDAKNNRLIVGFGAETYREKFVVGSCNWLIDNEFFSRAQNSKFKTQNLFVRIRHGGDLIPCEINALTHQRINVSLSEPQRGIAAGQSAVFYLKDGLVLGGGVIQPQKVRPFMARCSRL